MKITKISFQRASMELNPPFCPNWDPAPRTRFDSTLTIVETDGGVTGYGLGDMMDGFDGYEKYFVEIGRAHV